MALKGSIMNSRRIHDGHDEYSKIVETGQVVQEVYGWLIGHWAVRSLMFQAATSADIARLFN